MFKSLSKIATKLDGLKLYSLADIVDNVIEKVAKYEEDINLLTQYIDRPNTYIHFSDLEKLGLNPSSDYKTPIGIYGYPLTSTFFKHIINRTVPFAGKRDYIHIFETKTPLLELSLNFDYIEFIKQNKVKIFDFVDQRKDRYLKLNPITFDFEGVVAVVSKENLAKHPTIQNVDELFIRDCKDMIGDIINEFIDNHSGINPTENSTPRAFWYLLNSIAARDSLLSASLMRYLGVTGLHDPGKGILHPNEPEQAVIFKGNDIKLLKTIPNPIKFEPARAPSSSTLAFKFLRTQILNYFDENDVRAIHNINKFWNWEAADSSIKGTLLKQLKERISNSNYKLLLKTAIPEVQDIGKNFEEILNTDLNEFTFDQINDLVNNYRIRVRFESNDKMAVIAALKMLHADFNQVYNIFNALEKYNVSSNRTFAIYLWNQLSVLKRYNVTRFLKVIGDIEVFKEDVNFAIDKLSNFYKMIAENEKNLDPEIIKKNEKFKADIIETMKILHDCLEILDRADNNA